MMRAVSLRLTVAATLCLAATALGAQTGTIEGKVTSVTTGEPILGAEVSLVGISIGTRTGSGGTFTLLNVPVGPRELRVLAIGYKAASAHLVVLPDQSTTTTLELAPSVLQLDAIIVTGTPGQARVREVGNSIAQLNLSQVKDPPANLDQLLQARAPGLSVMQTSGMSGAGAQIRLRGAVSVSQSNQPLVYVDGVRVRSEGYRRNRPPFGDANGFRGGNYQASPLNDINPADIERIEVLKGSAASTLYGTEAAAGVIQIFTKRGSASGKPRWTFETDQGVAQLRPFGTDSVPYLNLRPAGSSHGQCHGNPVAGCSWIRNGYRQRYLGSVAGGTNAFQYFISGGWDDNDGVLPLDTEKKLTTRGNFTVALRDNLRLEWNTVYGNTSLSNTPSGNNAQGLVLNVYRAERNYRSSNDPTVIDSLLNQALTTDIKRLISGGTVYYTPVPWLSNRFTIGYDLAQQENRNLRPFGFVSAPQGILSAEQIRYAILTADYVGNVNFTLGGAIGSTFSFGGQSITSEEIRTTAYGEGFAGPGPPVVSNAATYVASESRLRVVNAGFFLQNVFKLRDRYFLTGGLRFDGNSAFGKSLGLQAYPKISGTYVISEEPFWPQSLGEVKLRGALGWSGRAPGAFDAIRSWTPCTSGGQSCFLPGNVGNPNIGPERTREAELGFDAALLHNHATIEFTWYHRLTTDALFAVRQVPSIGFNGPVPSQRANVGSMSNTGIELAVTGAVLDKPNWGLDLGASVYTNNGLVRDLGGAVPFAAGGGWVEAGFPPMVAIGTFIRNPNEIAAPDTMICRGVSLPNAHCTSTGFYVFGPQQPTRIFGVNATLRFPRGITLSARGEYQGGAWINDNASTQALIRSVRWPTCARAYPFLAAADTNSLTARERLECIPTNFSRAGDVNIMWFRQDFFKLRDMTLTVPVEWLMRRANKATLSITVQNFFRWINKDLRLFDPEMVGRDALDSQNRDIAEHVPPPAVVTVSLRALF